MTPPPGADGLPPAEPPAAPRGLTQRALGGMLWTFSGTGVQAVVQVLVLMALGRLLTPADFGLMGAAAVVVALSQIVSQVGVGPAVVQRKELNPTHVRVAFTISGVLGFVLGGAVWLSAPALAAFYRIPEVEPGNRVVRLELADHRTWTEVAQVTRGKTTRVAGSLEPIR